RAVHRRPAQSRAAVPGRPRRRAARYGAGRPLGAGLRRRTSLLARSGDRRTLSRPRRMRRLLRTGAGRRAVLVAGVVAARLAGVSVRQPRDYEAWRGVVIEKVFTRNTAIWPRLTGLVGQ